jgi:hypothetical protein
VNEENKFVFVLGAHRSGTSVAAGACDALGVRLGEQFIAASQENPKGFFEDEEVVRFNDRLLRSTWLSWDALGYLWQEDFDAPHYRPYRDHAVRLLRERFAGAPLAGLKDPRLSILLPFWRGAVREALDAETYYLLAVRHPAHCAASQKARNVADDDFHLIGKRREHVLLLWATYMDQALRAVDPQRLAVFDYERMLDAPEQALRRLAGFLAVDAPDDVAREYGTRFVDTSLNRSVAQGAVGRQALPQVWRWTESVYQSLRELAARDAIVDADIERVLGELDVAGHQSLYLRETQHMYGYAYKKVLSLRHRLIRCIREIGEGQLRERELRDERDRLEREVAALQGSLQEIFDSRAWKFILRVRGLKAALGLGPRRQGD